jgi:hypothetical protein
MEVVHLRFATADKKKSEDRRPKFEEGSVKFEMAGFNKPDCK